MCGIAGIVAPDALHYRARVSRMLDTIAHRGPDGRGIHTFANCGLGHVRLSIIDLETGAQPMLNGEHIGVTFNGEIYGYKPLREAYRYPYRTTSDTELLLAMYQAHGADMCRHLPGMFAFAVWDETQRTLLCGRDRFGEKPLYFATGEGGEFVFASEIRAILATGLVRPRLNRAQVVHYLQNQYVNPYHTIYSNVHTLPPGHRLVVRDGNVTVERYWSLPQPVGAIGIEDAANEFNRLLGQSIEHQLVADVPVGAFLSGGKDSTTIVALASGYTPQLHTYAFGVEGMVSELPFARDVAQRYGTSHTELQPPRLDIADCLQEMTRAFDEPFADSSNIPTYLISQLARKHAKVVLTGDGGDELFGGYGGWYQPLSDWPQSPPRRNPALEILYRGILAVVAIASRVMPGLSPDPIRTRLLHSRYNSLEEAYQREKYAFSRRQIASMLRFAPQYHSLEPIGHQTNTIDDAIRADIINYLPGDILTKIDRASMAHGLELRAPFLDVDFATFCISLPSRLKVTQSAEKIILKAACADLWPDTVKARMKHGFGGPVASWIDKQSVVALEKRLIQPDNERLCDIVSPAWLRYHRRLNPYQRWILLTLALWLDTHDYET